MKNYTETIGFIAVFLGFMLGLLKIIQILFDLAGRGEIGYLILTLLFSEILVFFYAIVPGIMSFIVLFLTCLPFYAIYKLIKG